jgi:ATP-dependent Lon protease
VYQIDAPDHDGARRIALSIYTEIRTAHDWGKRFPERPSAAVLERLTEFSPREMRRLVLGAFGNAQLAGRDAVQPEDIDDSRNVRKARIGF